MRRGVLSPAREPMSPTARAMRPWQRSKATRKRERNAPPSFATARLVVVPSATTVIRTTSPAWNPVPRIESGAAAMIFSRAVPSRAEPAPAPPGMSVRSRAAATSALVIAASMPQELQANSRPSYSRPAQGGPEKGESMRRLSTVAALVSGATLLVLGVGLATAAEPTRTPRFAKGPAGPDTSGPVEFRDTALGTNIAECPQAGMNTEPEALHRIDRDTVSRLSERGDDTRANTEYSCFPQNETTVDVNPLNPKNVIGGANDYRLGGSFSGVYATADGGRHWYDTLHVVPSLQNGDMMDSSGDPAITFDREGTAYLASIVFQRTNDTNGIFVNRSTNGGFTWTRPCVPIDVGTPTDNQARCGGPGDARQPGDGMVVFERENEAEPPPGGITSVMNFSVTFHDKEWIAAGPRPSGVQPTCFAVETKAPIPPGGPGCPESAIGPDRLYVTWTAFNNPTGVPFAVVSATIEVSYSDDRGRSWSPRRTI